MSKFKVGDWVVHRNPQPGSLAHKYNNMPKQILEINDGRVWYKYPKNPGNTNAHYGELMLAYKQVNMQTINEFLELKDE